MTSTNKADYSMFEEDIFAAWKGSERYREAVIHTSSALPTLKCNTNHTTMLSNNPDRCMILISRRTIPYTQITRGAVFSNLYSEGLHFSRCRQPNPMCIISFEDSGKAYKEAVEYFSKSVTSRELADVPTFDIIIGFTNDSEPIYIGEKYYIVSPADLEFLQEPVNAYGRAFVGLNAHYTYKHKVNAENAFRELTMKQEIKPGDIVVNMDEELKSGNKIFFRILEKCERVPSYCPQTDLDCFLAVPIANFDITENVSPNALVTNYAPTCVCSRDSIRLATKFELSKLYNISNRPNYRNGDLVQVVVETDEGNGECCFGYITDTRSSGLVEVSVSNKDFNFDLERLVTPSNIISTFGNFSKLPADKANWLLEVGKQEMNLIKDCRKEEVKPIEYNELDVVEFTMFDKTYVGILHSEIVDNVFAIKFDDDIVFNSTLWMNSIIHKNKIIRKLGTLKPGLNKPESLAAIEKLIEANKVAEPKFVLQLDALVSFNKAVELKVLKNHHFKMADTAIIKGEVFKKLYILVNLVNEVEEVNGDYLYSISFYENSLIVSAVDLVKRIGIRHELLFNTRKGAEFSLLNHKELWLQILTNGTTNQSAQLSA